MVNRVYKYGVVPLGLIPEEGISELFRSNKLWNRLVETTMTIDGHMNRRGETQTKNIQSLPTNWMLWKMKSMWLMPEKRTARMKRLNRVRGMLHWLPSPMTK